MRALVNTWASKCERNTSSVPWGESSLITNDITLQRNHVGHEGITIIKVLCNGKELTVAGRNLAPRAGLGKELGCSGRCTSR